MCCGSKSKILTGKMFSRKQKTNLPVQLRDKVSVSEALNHEVIRCESQFGFYLFCQAPPAPVLIGSLISLSRRSVRGGRPGGSRM